MLLELVILKKRGFWSKNPKFWFYLLLLESKVKVKIFYNLFNHLWKTSDRKGSTNTLQVTMLERFRDKCKIMITIQYQRQAKPSQVTVETWKYNNNRVGYNNFFTTHPETTLNHYWAYGRVLKYPNCTVDVKSMLGHVLQYIASEKTVTRSETGNACILYLLYWSSYGTSG